MPTLRSVTCGNPSRKSANGSPVDSEAGALVNADIVPVEEFACYGVIGLGVGGGEIVLCRIGEDDAEAKRVVQPVALKDGDLVRGVGFLH